MLPVCYQCVTASYQYGLGVGMQEKCGLPWVVGLDLSTTDTDMLSMVSALAVKRLDPPEDLEDPSTPADAPPTYYLCLMADNRQAATTGVACRRHVYYCLASFAPCQQCISALYTAYQQLVYLSPPPRPQPPI